MSVSGEGALTKWPQCLLCHWTGWSLWNTPQLRKHWMKIYHHRKTESGSQQSVVSVVGVEKNSAVCWLLDSTVRSRSNEQRSHRHVLCLHLVITTMPKHLLTLTEMPDKLLNRHSSRLKIHLYSEQWFHVSVISSDFYVKDFIEASCKMVK